MAGKKRVHDPVDPSKILAGLHTRTLSIHTKTSDSETESERDQVLKKKGEHTGMDLSPVLEAIEPPDDPDYDPEKDLRLTLESQGKVPIVLSDTSSLDNEPTVALGKRKGAKKLLPPKASRQAKLIETHEILIDSM